MHIRKATLVGLVVVVVALAIWLQLRTDLRADPGSLREAMFYDRLADNQVACGLCFRKCVIADGQRGFCRVRVNIAGTLYTLNWANAVALQLDPIEKEPLFHYLPGSRILGVSTASCNFQCQFCQNWHLSQQPPEAFEVPPTTPADLMLLASRNQADIISFTYNEPTVGYEYLYEVARTAWSRGKRVIFHTNGSMSPEPLRQLLPYIAAVTVDLKAFTAEFYRDVAFSSIQPVLDTITAIKEAGVWMEIVYLVVPTLNDDLDRIREMCRWLVDNIGPDVPVHFNRFGPAYKLTALPPTPVDTLESARRIALAEGLRFVYIGNVPGHENNSTFCPRCDYQVVHRVHFSPQAIRVSPDGRCPRCSELLPGLWYTQPE